MHTYIICEIGSNHDGDINQARKMIQSAKDCGADAVKFQIFKAETLYSKHTKDFDKYTNVYEMIKELEMPLSFFRECYNICSDVGIDFLATPFDEEAIDFLVDLGVKKIKIASFEFSDIRLVYHIVETKLPILASTGLASKDDIRCFLLQMKYGYNESDLTLLHCNSAYPTPDIDVNLRSINYLQGWCRKVGYSDHSVGIVVPTLAVAAGACVIEKHFTLNRKNNGPDHAFAIEPDQFYEMVKRIRECEIMLGKKELYRSESEIGMEYAKRSIVAKRFIPRGKHIEYEDITTKRPGSGIPAHKYFAMKHRPALRDINEDEIITKDMVYGVLL